MKQSRLTLIALIMMLIGIVISAFTLWYAVVNRKAFETTLQNNLRKELANFSLQLPDDTTIDDQKVLLAIAKYCAAHNDCKGENGQSIIGPKGDTVNGINGKTPIKGVDYFDGSDGATPACLYAESKCVGADGYTPIKGVDYNDGEKGENGKEIERRCNPDRRRMEWRTVGEANWQVEYKLAPGQECE